MFWSVLMTLAFSQSLLAGPERAFLKPKATLTPGYLCTWNDPDFSGAAYPEGIARCVRHVLKSQKTKVAMAYGLKDPDWSKVEFDHLIPLCAGGANDSRNIWPQPITQALGKDRVEDEVCRKMAAGTMTQAQMLKRMKAWFESQGVYVLPTLDE